MDTSTTAGALLIAGSLVFDIGAGVGVPRVHTQRDPQVRLQMLEDGLVAWRVAQPLYAVGPLITAVGVGVLATDAPAGWAQVLLAISCGLLLAGALAWAWVAWLRTVDVRAFALGTLPAWPYVTYVYLTVAGLAALGAGLLAGDQPRWLGWFTLVGDLLLLGWYLRTKDLPPFTFYVLLTVVGAVVL